MVSAIGASPFPTQNTAGRSTGGLEYQLDQYEIKLADWTSCPSCNTPEGKAKIAEFSAKVSEIKHRLEAVDAAKQNSKTDASDVNDRSNTNGAVRQNLSSGFDAAPSSTTLPFGSLGNRLDVFA